MIRCFIEGQEYNIVREPQIYVSRSETENSATIVINTDSETNFDIYSKVLIEYGQNESFQFVIESVKPFKLAPDYFEHTITLVEPKSFFKTIYPSDRSFSRLLETAEPGVFRPENLGEILNVYKTHLEAYHDVLIDFDDTDTVYQTRLPQKEYVSRNFLEIVTDLFRRIESIPRVEWQIVDNEVIWYITYERYAERNNAIDLSEFQSLSKEFDNIDFGSRMLAQAKNAVYENVPVVFPSKPGYVKPRTETKVFQDSAAFVELDSNIFQLRRVILKDIPIHLVNLESNFAEPYGIRDIDITKYVVTKEEQDTFDEVGRDESVSEELSVRNTVLYSFNSNRIFGFFTPNFETFFGFQANLNHLQNAINSYLQFELPLLEPINAPEGTFYQLSPPGFHDYGDGIIDNRDLVTNDEGEVIKKARFNITYVPQRDIDFEIDRQDVTRTANTQVLNSQADSIIELGRYKQSISGLINRLGTEQLQYKKIYAYDEPFPKLGDYFGEYIITEINYTLFRKHIDALFILSKNFNNIKAEYAVSREPSPFTITGKTVNTNIITKTYVELSKSKKIDSDEFATQFGRNAILNMFDYDVQFESEVQEAAFIPLGIDWDQEYGQDVGIHMPVMKSGNGGAMTFHFQFRNPQLAGYALKAKDADRFWQLDALLKSGILYTNNDGYLPNYTLQIGQDLTVNDNYMYPLIDLQLPSPFKKTFEINDYPLELDTNARYSHTHHVQPVTDDASHIIINENWTLLHPLVTGQAIDTLKFYQSSKPFSIFDHVIRDGDTEFFNNLILDREEQSIVLDLQPPSTDYWCITDENDNILVAFNYSPENFKLYFNFIRFRNNLVDGEITFETFGGIPVPETIIAPAGSLVDRPLVDPVRQGFVFLGWSEEFPLLVDAPSIQVDAEYVEIVSIDNPTLTEAAPYYEVMQAFQPTERDIVKPSITENAVYYIVQQGFQPTERDIVKPSITENAIYYVVKQVVPLPQVDITSPTLTENATYYTVQQLPTEPATVTATFDTDDGSPTPEDQTGIGAVTVQEPETVTKTGYTFLGWVDDNEPLPQPLVTFPYTITQDTNFTAKWQVITYNITYVMNSGTNNANNPATFTVEDLPISLQTPTRNYFDFVNWTPSAEIVTTGNTTRTANWTQSSVASPSAAFDDATLTSVTFNIKNNETRNSGFVDMNWRIEGPLPATTQRASGQVQGAVPGQDYSVSATNLASDSTYKVFVEAFDTLSDLLNSQEISAEGDTLIPPVVTATPTLSNLTSDNPGEISFTLTNNETTSNVKFAWEVRTADLAAELVASQGLDDEGFTAGPENYTVTNLDEGADYVVRGRAIGDGNFEVSAWTDFQQVTTAATPPPQTEAPSFTITGLSATQLVVSIKNEDTAEATIKYELDNDDPQEFTVTIPGGQSNTQIISNLQQNTEFTLYATAEATGKTLSEVSEIDFKTEYIVRARSAGVTPVGVTIDGQSFTLTTTLQEVRQDEGTISLALNAPLTVFVGGITYDFVEWFNITTQQSISTNTTTTLSNVNGPTDIEVRYIPGGF